MNRIVYNIQQVVRGKVRVPVMRYAPLGELYHGRRSNDRRRNITAVCSYSLLWIRTLTAKLGCPNKFRISEIRHLRT
jgi:hypothetical protein